MYYYHPDHLGSSSYITDANGEVSQHVEYFAFGETFLEEHSNTDRTPYLYNGKELDEETGLYYYGARYYDAMTSVWQSVDPLAEERPGISPYNFVQNNPLIRIDPTGMIDIIYIGNNGKVTRVEETGDEFNIFVMEETSQVLHLNDREGLDKWMYTNDDFQKGDRIFFPISDKKFQAALDEAGKGNWYNLVSKSHSKADFTLSYLVENYFGLENSGQEKVYLEDGFIRTHYKENSHYFRFGNDDKMLNLYDAGNFMWGSWMNYSGYDYSTAQFGSQLNESFFDSDADQSAIRAGYFYYEELKLK